MPKNPERASRGGDVEGTVKTSVEWSVGSPIEIARASIDPGYGDDCLQHTLEAGYVSEADLLDGYCSYGTCIGEGRPKQMIGGK